MAEVLSVGEFLDTVNELLGAQEVVVQGEITEAKALPSGLFLTLKDQTVKAVMGCYMSPYAYRASGVSVEPGMRVKVGGIGSVYQPSGRFSFRVETLEIAGEGSLRKAYEALKRKLQEEGLFDRKRPLAEFVGRIGLVTSRTGAVIDDFRRNLLPLGLRVLHHDVRVEGTQAVPQITAAIRDFDYRSGQIDALVLVRGGGSLEDLQAFNNELVVRSVFGSRVPTVVAIGHDRDVPLAQLVADASASTPTAVAGVINATWDRLQNVGTLAGDLFRSMDGALSDSRTRLDGGLHRLVAHLARLAGTGARLEQHFMQAVQRVGQGIASARQAVDAAEKHLAASSPERSLRLGYSIVTDQAGAVIRSVRHIRPGALVTTRVADGRFASEVKDSTLGEQ